jgi:proteasome lid subunit RPN8/RPN11
MAQQVIFSERAYIALMTETFANINTETGGIFLGHFDNDKWYIIETIDPGPKSVFSPAYFEYDQAYINHLINKINLLYKNPLRIVGLWHRHPGSMDYFSSTDDNTHAKFAEINSYGVISALVNIDPSFRITFYTISPTGSKSRGHLTSSKRLQSYRVGNEYIPADLLSYNSTDILEYKINSALQRRPEPDNKNKLFYSIIKKASEANHDVIDVRNKNHASIPVSEEDIDKILEVLEEDFDFFKKYGINYDMSAKDGPFLLYSGDKNNGVEFFINNEKVYIRYKNKTFQYSQGLFSRVSKPKR